MSFTEAYPLAMDATNEEMLDWLRALSERLGGSTPRMVDMAPYHMRFVDRFGSIRKAQAAAGFKPNRRGGWSANDHNDGLED